MYGKQITTTAEIKKIVMKSGLYQDWVMPKDKLQSIFTACLSTAMYGRKEQQIELAQIFFIARQLNEWRMDSKQYKQLKELELYIRNNCNNKENHVNKTLNSEDIVDENVTSALNRTEEIIFNTKKNSITDDQYFNILLNASIILSNGQNSDKISYGRLIFDAKENSNKNNAVIFSQLLSLYRKTCAPLLDNEDLLKQKDILPELYNNCAAAPAV